ncbi:MAG TPA: hypothetical protein VMT56_00655, partial [Candidatus Bathyarchaeia archaeon]|nr:hypothetical protein [Candidatus Bathyarchaeia archaeon]
MSNPFPDIAVVNGARTPMGSYCGKLRDFTAQELAAIASVEAMKRSGVKPAEIGHCVMGNASGIVDGGAAVVVMPLGEAQRRGLNPQARIVSRGIAGVDPALMGSGPVPATHIALKKAGLTLSDIDLIELNEAFAAQCLPVMKELGLDHDKTNVNGGAIALGHPLGATGTRLLITLMNELR